MKRFRSILTYLWVLPTTSVGLLFAPIAIVGGGTMRWVSGVVEIEGKWVGLLLRRCVPIPGGACAMTLGHIVIAGDQLSLDRTRDHERIHVRQCERWGPLFIPAYLLASLVVKLRGRDAYRDNPFEREAYDSSSDVRLSSIRR